MIFAAMKKISVYCSGPLFSPEERTAMAEIDAVLKTAGYDTFLPQRDGLEPVFLPFLNSPLNISALGLSKLADRSVFRFDLHKLVHECDVLVMNVNGRVPDEGACVEAGIAFALGKPVVLYKDDARTVFNGLDNAMLTGLTAVEVVRTLADIPARVKEAYDECRNANQGWAYSAARLAPHILSEATKGESAEKIIRTVKPG